MGSPPSAEWPRRLTGLLDRMRNAPSGARFHVRLVSPELSTPTGRPGWLRHAAQDCQTRTSDPVQSFESLPATCPAGPRQVAAGVLSSLLCEPSRAALSYDNCVACNP
jgi:hypothetical protein